jgi:CDGSH-type Zn-finger protein
MADRLWELARAATALRGQRPEVAELAEAAAALQDLAIRLADDESVASRIGELAGMQAGLPADIKAMTNGPYPVTNARVLADWLGQPLPLRPQLVLCRCGGSKIKPLCDGSHAAIGFTTARIPRGSATDGTPLHHGVWRLPADGLPAPRQGADRGETSAVGHAADGLLPGRRSAQRSRVPVRVGFLCRMGIAPGSGEFPEWRQAAGADADAALGLEHSGWPARLAGLGTHRDRAPGRAEASLERLRAGTMPCDGGWPEERTNVFARWVDGGKPT